MFSDLSPEQFARGLTTFCREHPEIYPGTNVVAHIRNYGLGVVKRDPRADAVLAFNLLRADKALPQGINAQAANEAWRLAMRASSGLTADIGWDERRFVDIYTGIAGTR